MRDQLVSVQLPEASNGILNFIDDEIIETSRSITLAVKNPSLHAWMDRGEKNEEIGEVYALLESVVESYGTLGANFISNNTKQYTELFKGNRDHSYILTDHDVWFEEFRKSNVPFTVVAYVNDPVWKTRAYINRRV